MAEKDWVEEIKRHFDVATENLEDKIQIVAEGQSLLRDEFKDFKSEMGDFKVEVRNEFKEVKALIKLSYAELENRVTNIEKR